MSEQNATQIPFAITKHTGFMIHGSTGCSCCRNDNIICGMHETIDGALERAIQLHDQKMVCSQYSDNGIYSIYELEYEKLPDERIIIANRIFSDDCFFESGEIANDLQYAGTLRDTIQ